MVPQANRYQGPGITPLAVHVERQSMLLLVQGSTIHILQQSVVYE